MSVVIPAYNSSKYIAAAIDSVLQQTVTDWEIQIVDDCSTDNTAEVVKPYLQKYKDIHYYCLSENSGAAAARNEGVMRSSGRYIAFLDSDDLWLPDKLEQELVFMHEHQAGFVFSAYYFGDEDARLVGKAVQVPMALTYHKALTRTIIFTSTVLIDTWRIPKEAVMMPDIPSEDTATWWRILQRGITAYGLNEPLTIYRRSKGTLSANKSKSIRRIWHLYREIAQVSPPEAFLYLVQWVWRTTIRRLRGSQIF